MDKSGHGKKESSRGALTNWRAQTDRQCQNMERKRAKINMMCPERDNSGLAVNPPAYYNMNQIHTMRYRQEHFCSIIWLLSCYTGCNRSEVIFCPPPSAVIASVG